MNTIPVAPGTSFRVGLPDIATVEQLVAGGVDPTTVKWRLSNPGLGQVEWDDSNPISVKVTLFNETAPFAVLFTARTTDGKNIFGCLPFASLGDNDELVGLGWEPIIAELEIDEASQALLDDMQAAADAGQLDGQENAYAGNGSEYAATEPIEDVPTNTAPTEGDSAGITLTGADDPAVDPPPPAAAAPASEPAEV